MDRAEEAHWQTEWSAAGLHHARVDPGRSKFYAIVAYPGTSGFLHIGHLRGLTIADTLHRLHRMQGRSVFFPTGTHATGLPAVTFAQKVKAREPTTVQQLEDNLVPQERWAELEEPERAARFLGQTYLAACRSIGFLIDERAYLTTIDPDYQAFIRWQFHRLDRAEALGQAEHYASVCPVCGPVSVDPSETDLSSGGTAEWIVYTSVPFRLDDGRLLLAATLRPETLFGATNLWVAPRSRLVHWHRGAEQFLVTEAAVARLLEQHGGHAGAAIPSEQLDGAIVTVPLTGERIPVVLSELVDPRQGTGVVMSVPAHAPADWVAVGALTAHTRHRLAEPKEIIVVDPSTVAASERPLLDGPGPPAARAARAAGASSLADAAALHEATQRLYRLEHGRGRMTPDLLGGRPVAEARAAVEEELRATGESPVVREFSEPVVCRNGHEVVIRRVPDQWFLRYGDPVWKEKTRRLVERLEVSPPSYKEELDGILDWLGDRPCTRRGRWLGTAFPKDESWVIEPIADSTLYPLYYPVRRFVASGELAASALTDAFFDYVLLGEGPGEPSIPRELQESVRREVGYWYPLDLNIGGKEHKRVHFPVFLATHALLLPEALQPLGLLVHWWITDRGGKISKKQVSSKGGAIPPLREALDRWGADALRLVYLWAASPDQDFEWDPSLADAAAQRLAEVERLARQALGEGDAGPPLLDRWLESRAHELLEGTLRELGAARLRSAAELLYAEFPLLLRRYATRGGLPGPALRRVALAWVRAMSPFTPHLAESVGSGRFEGLVASQGFPAGAEFPYDANAIASESLLELVETDLREVLRPDAPASAEPIDLALFVAAPWKRTIDGWLLDLPAAPGAPDRVGAIMARAAAHPELSAYRSKIAAYVRRFASPARGGAASEATPPADEVGVLKESQGYLVRRFGLRSIAVYPEEESEPHDPLGRRERARPGRPAFYVAGRRPAASASGSPPTVSDASNASRS